MRQKLFPKVEGNLSLFGENLKAARLRRKLSMEQVAERAGVSRSTLGAMEKGSASVSIGSYMQVLFVLGLDEDILKMAYDEAWLAAMEEDNLSYSRFQYG